MLRRALVALCLLSLPVASLAQENAERFLAPGSQFYLRWDGFAAHREAFDKTAAGQTLQGETGTFLKHLWSYINEQLEVVLNQVDAEAAKGIRQLPGAIETIGRNGFSMAIDVRQINPPEIEATFVFPRSGGPKGKLHALVTQILEVTRAETKEVRVDDVVLRHFAMEPLHWAFGSAGDTAVMVVGTVDPASVVRRAADKGNNIAKHPLHKELRGFKEFHVWSQGFIDIPGLAKPIAALSPEASRLIEELGLGGLKSITFHSGFDGPAARAVVDINMPGPRKGLLALSKGRKFSLKELPILPDDVASFSAGSLDAPLMYDTFAGVIDGGVRVFSADAADAVKEGIKQIELLIGVKLRDDLLASLGDMVVSYSSPSEGLLGLGRVTMVKVRDPKKLLAALDGVHKAFPGIPGVELDVKKRTYRGVDLVELHLGASFTTPTFALHKGWLVFANYPQPVHGYIMRSQGDLPAWKADAKFVQAVEPFPKEFVSISYSDPRPGVQLLLSLVPPAMSALNGVTRQFVPGSKAFDVSTIPHPQDATRHLFPNISVTTEDERKLRIDSRSSLPF